LLFHEPLQSAQLASFLLIWLALAVFSWDTAPPLIHAKKRAATNSAPPRFP
jgi:EamA domain-containing membrane protein RarD